MADLAKTVLLVGGGAAAAWGLARWRNKTRDRDDAWAAGRDDDDMTPAVDTPAPSTPSNAGGGLTRKFDAIFGVHGMGLPVPYLRALAARESGLDPTDPKGLINVVDVVREEFNRRHGTSYAAKDLTNPVINLMIASDALRRIIDSYAKHHPDVANLREDWSNRHFVELLTFGWNVGFSESRGVGRVVRSLKERGQTSVTLTDVVRAAHDAGASHWLWAHPKKVAWTRSVADLYEREVERDRRDGLSSPRPAPVALELGRPIPEDVRAIVSSGWASPRHGRAHRALDIPVQVGTPVLAVDDGVVVHVTAQPTGPAGIWVAIEHPSGLVSRYLHLSRVDVKRGARVRKGDTLGASGDTGDSAAPHLHLDLRAPLALLRRIERTYGAPRSGWGPSLRPFGYSIPGERWVPVDGYDDRVARHADAEGIALYGAAAAAIT